MAAAAPPPPGALSQLPGTAGCISINGGSEHGAGTCAVGRGFDSPESVVVSPDDHNVYVGSYSNTTTEPSIAVFTRNPSSGALTQLPGTAGCLTADGASQQAGANSCTRVRGFSNVGDGRDLAFTSDGRWAYLVGQGGGTRPPPLMLIFKRDPATGALTQLSGTAGCISSDGSSQDGPHTCQADATLVDPNGITIPPDNRFVYATDFSSSVSRVHVFARNTTTGGLTEIQCLRRAPASTGCTVARMVGDDDTFTITPDGRHAYSGHFLYDGISIFDRDPSTGLLTQKPGTAGCISDNGKDDTGASTCGIVRGLKGAWVTTINPNGKTLYVSDYDTNAALAVFGVNADGTLTQLSGPSGCVSADGSSSGGPGTCKLGRAMFQTYVTAISPDGASLYVPEWANAPSGPGGLAILSLNRSTGAATQLPGQLGCVTADGSANGVASQCAVGRSMKGGYSAAVSHDGRSVYFASYGAQGVAIFVRQQRPTCSSPVVPIKHKRRVTIHLTCLGTFGETLTRKIVTKPHHGKLGTINQSTGTVTYKPGKHFKKTDHFTFVASDGTNVSAPATVTITSAKPKLSHVHQSGHELIFTLNEPATVTITVRVGHHRHRLKVSGQPGTNSVTLTLKGVPAGRHKATLQASNVAGKSHTVKKRLRFF